MDRVGNTGKESGKACLAVFTLLLGRFQRSAGAEEGLVVSTAP
jgi:hypothetical protein